MNQQARNDAGAWEDAEAAHYEGQAQAEEYERRTAWIIEAAQKALTGMLRTLWAGGFVKLEPPPPADTPAPAHAPASAAAKAGKTPQEAADLALNAIDDATDVVVPHAAGAAARAER